MARRDAGTDHPAPARARASFFGAGGAHALMRTWCRRPAVEAVLEHRCGLRYKNRLGRRRVNAEGKPGIDGQPASR
jgi:hypothetical protein